MTLQEKVDYFNYVFDLLQDVNSRIEGLQKAIGYLNKEIENLKRRDK